MISKRYMLKRLSEQEKVIRKTTLEGQWLICFSMRYWVIIVLPSQLKQANEKKKLMLG